MIGVFLLSLSIFTTVFDICHQLSSHGKGTQSADVHHVMQLKPDHL